MLNKNIIDAKTVRPIKITKLIVVIQSIKKFDIKLRLRSSEYKVIYYIVREYAPHTLSNILLI